MLGPGRLRVAPHMRTPPSGWFRSTPATTTSAMCSGRRSREPGSRVRHLPQLLPRVLPSCSTERCVRARRPSATTARRRSVSEQVWALGSFAPRGSPWRGGVALTRSGHGGSRWSTGALPGWRDPLVKGARRCAVRVTPGAPSSQGGRRPRGDPACHPARASWRAGPGDAEQTRRVLVYEPEFGTVMARARLDGSSMSGVLHTAWDRPDLRCSQRSRSQRQAPSWSSSGT